MGTVHVIGLMSGTSCDGMAGCLVRLEGPRPRPTVMASTLIAYPRGFQSRLMAVAAGQPVPGTEIAALRAGLARYGARAVSTLLRGGRISALRIACVGSHGQTLFHAPRGIPPTTWQLDDLGTLTELTGITAIGDFRSRDVAAGGEGAPLAPWAHHRFYTHPREDRLILNLGGIANVTWLPAGKGPGDVRAFDTGPANMLIDLLAARASRGRNRFDAGGRLSAAGQPHLPTLRRLLAHPFFRRRPPRSTGREEFGADLLPVFRGLPARDALATAAEFTGRSIAREIRAWLPRRASRATVYVGGGGAQNPDLMRRLAHAASPQRVRPLDRLGIRSGDVESACFALLAWARLRGIPNVLPAVTGARRAVCAGVICPR